MLTDHSLFMTVKLPPLPLSLGNSELIQDHLSGIEMSPLRRFLPSQWIPKVVEPSFKHLYPQLLNAARLTIEMAAFREETPHAHAARAHQLHPKNPRNNANVACPNRREFLEWCIASGLYPILND